MAARAPVAALPQDGVYFDPRTGKLTLLGEQLIASLNTLASRTGGAFGSYLPVPHCTVATLPAAPQSPDTRNGWAVFVTDESGGATLAYYDGSNWRRVVDGATVS